MSDLNALVGIDFSIIGTKLHAAYEKKGEDGYAVLLAPSLQEAETGVSIGQVIKDIKTLIGGADGVDDMTNDLTSSLSGMKKDGGTLDLNKIIVKLNMAYLYICRNEKDSSNNITEYAFQLQIVTKGFIPEQISQIVDVSNVSLSVWNTTRKQVTDKMQLITIDDYLGIAQNS